MPKLVFCLLKVLFLQIVPWDSSLNHHLGQICLVHFFQPPNPGLPKSSKFLVSGCLEPLKAEPQEMLGGSMTECLIDPNIQQTLQCTIFRGKLAVGFKEGLSINLFIFYTLAFC